MCNLLTFKGSAHPNDQKKLKSFLPKYQKANEILFVVFTEMKIALTNVKGTEKHEGDELLINEFTSITDVDASIRDIRVTQHHKVTKRGTSPSRLRDERAERRLHCFLLFVCLILFLPHPCFSACCERRKGGGPRSNVMHDNKSTEHPQQSLWIAVIVGLLFV